MSKTESLRANGIVQLILSAALAANVTFAMVGCGNKVAIDIPVGTEEAQEETMAEPEITDPTPEPEEKEIAAVLGKSGQCFSEGLAWVKFAEHPGSPERYGCIDKKGNVLFAFPDGNDKATPAPFDNGYSFIYEGDVLRENGHLTNDCQVLAVVDTKGNVKTFKAVELGDTSNAEKEDRSFVAFGGGYFVFCRHQKADFDNSDYPWIYEIYDAKGNYIDHLSCDDSSLTASYCGQGAFQFTYSRVGNDPVLYFASSDRFIQVDTSTDVVFVDGEDTAYLATGKDVEVAQAVGDEEWQDSLVSGLVFVTKDGEILTGVIPEDVKPYGKAPRVSSGKLILKGNGTLCSYDVKDGTLSEMPEEYAQHNVYIEGVDIMYHDNVCATIATGADGKYYLCAYDTNWNRLFDPLETSSLTGDAYYSDGLMALKLRSDDGNSYPAVIDKKGTVIISKNEGYFSQSSDDVIISSGAIKSDTNDNIAKIYMSDDGVPLEYYDSKGNKLFDSLNIEKMKTLSFTM